MLEIRINAALTNTSFEAYIYVLIPNTFVKVCLNMLETFFPIFITTGLICSICFERLRYISQIKSTHHS